MIFQQSSENSKLWNRNNILLGNYYLLRAYRRIYRLSLLFCGWRELVLHVVQKVFIKSRENTLLIIIIAVIIMIAFKTLSTWCVTAVVMSNQLPIFQSSYNCKTILLSTVNFTKINTPPWFFFTFFKLYKWYQIAQRTVDQKLFENTNPFLPNIRLFGDASLDNYSNTRVFNATA